MPIIVHSNPGRVTGLWGSAMVRLRDGKMHPLKLGDVVNKGDLLLTSHDGIVELTLANEVSRLKVPAGEIPDLITALNKGDPAVVPLAAVTTDDSGGLMPAERVERIAESITSAALGLAPQELVAGTAAQQRIAPELQQPAQGLSNAIVGVEEGPAVSLRLAAPVTAGAVTALTVDKVPSIGEIRKADGSAVVVGTTLSSEELTGLVYIPPSEYDGRSPVGAFSYMVDDALTRTTRSVQIVVLPVNDAPTASSEQGAGSEDTAIPIEFLGKDVDGTVVGFTLIATPSQGRLLIDNGATQIVAGQTISAAQAAGLVFLPTANFNGDIEITFSAVDDGGRTSTAARYALTVTPVNDAPRTLADQVPGTEDTAATFTAAQLLGNDSDVEGDVLNITSVSGATGGSATLNPDGSVSFTPNPNFFGTASFNYIASDGAASSASTLVRVLVAPVNDAPVALPDALAAVEDTPFVFSAASLLGNDSDVDADPLRIASVVSGSGGTATLNANGTVSFTPNANFNGLADFSYVASDGALNSASTSVSINVAPVNDAPVAQPDVLSAIEDTPITFAPALLLVNDADVEGSALRIASVTSGSGGVAVLNDDGSVSFTPAPNFNGLASFSYTVSDGAALSSSVTVSVNVQPVNDAPVAVPDSLTAQEDTVATFAAAQLLANDSDVDGNALTIVSVTSAIGGSAVLNANGTVSFTPLLNFNGPGSFSYVASDGSLRTASTSVAVNVAPVNDAPLALPDALTATEDIPAVYTAAQLLGNDQDVDGNVLSIASVTSVSGGTAVLNANGTVAFTPGLNFNGVASFTYVASDGAALSQPTPVTVLVAAVNDAPLALADTLNAIEDTASTFTAAQLLGNDADVEGDALSIASVSGATGGSAKLNPDGSVSFAPNPDFFGTASFNYIASDGAASSASTLVRVLVAPVNDAPAALPDTLAAVEDTPFVFSAASLLGNDSDVDADLLRIASVVSGSDGTATLNANGTVSFTPNANFNGLADFSYVASDGALNSASTSVSINVAPVNDAPVASTDSAVTGRNQTLILSAAALLANDADVDLGDSLRLVSVQSALNGTIALDPQGNVVFSPTTNYSGPASFSYTVADSAGATATGTVNVSIIASGVKLVVPEAIFSLSEGTVTANTANAPFSFTAQDDLEATALLTAGVLDTFNPPAGSTLSFDQTVDVFNGSLVSQSVQLRAGSVVAFDWEFFNGEFIFADVQSGFNDMLLVVVTSPTGGQQIVQLSSSEQTGLNVNGNAADAAGTFQYASPGPGQYTFTWLVTNGLDNTKNSSASIASPRFVTGTGSSGTPVPLPIYVESTDPSSTAILSTTVSGVPLGAALSAGVNLGAGLWSLTASDLSGLDFLPPVGFVGSVNLTVTATTTDPLTGATASTSQQSAISIDSATATDKDMGTQRADSLTGTAANNHLQGFGGDDTLDGGAGNDLLFGNAGNDVITGGAGNDSLDGGVGDDTLSGGTGIDRIASGAGNDRLTGGTGSDTFAWTLVDRGLPGNPATDIIVDFGFALPAADGDVLDLRDLLVGEAKAGLATGNLDQFLDFDTTSTPGSTVIRISTIGAFAAGTYSPAAEDQRITLEGVDLRAIGVLGLGVNASDADIVQQLLQRGKLMADGP